MKLNLWQKLFDVNQHVKEVKRKNKIKSEKTLSLIDINFHVNLMCKVCSRENSISDGNRIN